MQRQILRNFCVASCVLALAATADAGEVSNPTVKVLELIADLQDTMIKKGEASQAIYNEFSAWCAERAQELGLELKSEKSDKKDLDAQIVDDKATIATKDMTIDKEAQDISEAEQQISTQSKIRSDDARDFSEEEAELIDIINTLKRATAVVEKELAGGSSLLQMVNIKPITDVVAALVKASMANNDDAQRLAALIQSGQEETGSPSAAAYQSGSAGVVTLLKDLLDKAEKELNSIRMKEEGAQQNHNMLKSSLNNEIRYSKQDKNEASKDKSNAKEEKAIDEGDLGITVKDIEADVKTLADLRRVCIAKVEEFTAMATSRNEELKALAEAKKIISEKMTGTASQVYGPASLVQLLSSTHAMTSGQDKATNQALKSIREMATNLQSVELSQLVSRIQATLRSGSQTGENPFAKVVGMISDMIAKLEQEAEDNADHEEYCTKELGETKTKKSERTDLLEELATKQDQMMSRSKKLKRQVARLQKNLAQLQSSQTEMDNIRQKENAEYLDEKATLDKGLEGVRGALKTLQDYYGTGDENHQIRRGEATSIISLLETCESDFSKSLAELMAGEQTAIANYKQQSQDNKVDKESKETAVEFKTKEYTSLDKSVVELKSDKNGVSSELEAVKEYLGKLMKECAIPVETYAEKKERREKEIAGLREALNVLESETSLVQRGSKRSLRGAAHLQLP